MNLYRIDGPGPSSKSSKKPQASYQIKSHTLKSLGGGAKKFSDNDSESDTFSDISYPNVNNMLRKSDEKSAESDTSSVMSFSDLGEVTRGAGRSGKSNGPIEIKMLNNLLNRHDLQERLKDVEDWCNNNCLLLKSTEFDRPLLEVIICHKNITPELVELLLNKGADPLIENKVSGKVAIQVAHDHQCSDQIIHFLAENMLKKAATRFSKDNIDNVAKTCEILRNLKYSLNKKWLPFLINCILLSKHSGNKYIHGISANAITLCVMSNFPMSGRNFSGVQIPGANLSNGIFDHTDFTNANLQKVNFYQCYLRGVDFTNAIMTGVKFDISTKELLHERQITGIQYIDGLGLITIGKDKKLQIIKLDTTYLFDMHVESELLSVSAQKMTEDEIFIGTGEQNGTMKLFQIKFDPESSDPTTHEVRETHDHKGGVTSLAWHPKTTHMMIASGGSDRTIRLTVLDEKGSFPLRSHQAGITSVKFNPNGDYLFSAGWDKLFKIWDVNKRVLKFSLNGFPGVIRSIDTHSKEKKIACVGDSNEVKIWSELGNFSDSIETPLDTIGVIEYRKGSDNVIVSGTTSQQPMTYEINTHSKDVIHTLKEPDLIKAMTTLENKIITAGGRNCAGHITLWDTSLATSLRQTGHNHPIEHMVLSDDLLLSTDKSGFFLWDLTERELRFKQRLPLEPYETIDLVSKNRFVCYQTSDKIQQLWDAKTGIAVSLQITGQLSFSPDGKYMASIDEFNIHIFQIESVTKIKKTDTLFTENKHSIQNVIWNEPQLIALDSQGDITIWDNVMTKQNGWKLDLEDQKVTDMRFVNKCLILDTQSNHQFSFNLNKKTTEKLENGIFNKNSKMIELHNGRVIILNNGQLRLFNTNDNNIEEFSNELDDPKPIQKLTINRTKSHIIIEEMDQLISVYETTKFTLLKEIQSPLCLSHTGDYLAYSKSNHHISILKMSADSISEVFELKGNTDQISAISFNNNGDLIISASFDKSIKVWIRSRHENKWLLFADFSKCPTNGYASEIKIEDAIGLGAKEQTMLRNMEV